MQIECAAPGRVNVMGAGAVPLGPQHAILKAQVRIKPSHSPSAQASVCSIFSPW